MKKAGHAYIEEYARIIDHEAVAVELEVFVNGQHETVTGISKCAAPDRFDPELGYELAYWRAVERLSLIHI